MGLINFDWSSQELVEGKGKIIKILLIRLTMPNLHVLIMLYYSLDFVGNFWKGSRVALKYSLGIPELLGSQTKNGIAYSHRKKRH